MQLLYRSPGNNIRIFSTAQESGHGLVMSIVYRIIKRHFGDINAESVSNRERFFAAAKEIKKIDLSVLVIQMSGGVLQERESRRKETGIDFILPKPFTLDDLNKMVITEFQTKA